MPGFPQKRVSFTLARPAFNDALDNKILPGLGSVTRHPRSDCNDLLRHDRRPSESASGRTRGNRLLATGDNPQRLYASPEALASTLSLARRLVQRTAHSLSEQRKDIFPLNSFVAPTSQLVYGTHQVTHSDLDRLTYPS